MVSGGSGRGLSRGGNGSRSGRGAARSYSTALGNSSRVGRAILEDSVLNGRNTCSKIISIVGRNGISHLKCKGKRNILGSLGQLL